MCWNGFGSNEFHRLMEQAVAVVKSKHCVGTKGGILLGGGWVGGLITDSVLLHVRGFDPRKNFYVFLLALSSQR